MSFRPRSWDEYIGQDKLKDRLRIQARAAESRGDRMGHVLLIGPAGCGKTSLAYLIAHDTGMDFQSFMMPINEQLLRMFVEEFQGVVLLDEIHRSNMKQQEQLLTLIEDGYIQTDTGARIVNHNLTVVAATTEGDRIITPLYDRFTIRPPFDPYSDDEMAQIVAQFGKAYGVNLPEETLLQLAAATLGVPRNAKSFVQMAVDLEYEYDRLPTAEEILEVMRVTPEGLTADHVRYCTMLASAGGQAGLDLMRTLLGLPPRAVENLEIQLIKMGMLERQRSGRVLTTTGFRLAGDRTPRFGQREEIS